MTYLDFYDIAEYGNKNWKGNFTPKEIAQNAYEYLEEFKESMQKPLEAALENFNYKTQENYIPRCRLEELATKFKDGLIEDDKESAMEYFTYECEMTDYEMEFFGIETESEEE